MMNTFYKDSSLGTLSNSITLLGAIHKVRTHGRGGGRLNHSVTLIYYIPTLNQAFSLVDSTVQYFPSYCTLQKLNQIAWKPACNKRNTTLRWRTKQYIALSLVKPVNSPFGFVHQVWPASCNTLLRSAPSCSIPIVLISWWRHKNSVQGGGGSKILKKVRTYWMYGPLLFKWQSHYSCLKFDKK